MNRSSVVSKVHKLSVTCDEIIHQCGRDAENPHQQVAHSQIKDEQIGDRPHAPVLQHDETHQAVSHHAEQEDEEVRHGQAGCHRKRVLVVWVVGHAGEVGGVAGGDV